MSIRDCAQTPPELFNCLNDFYHFDIDVAADDTNSKCRWWITKEINALQNGWFSNGTIKIKSAFCNPPFSNLMAWHKIAYEQIQNYPDRTAVVLSPLDCSTKWFDYAYNHACLIWLLTPRVQFIPPLGVKYSTNDRCTIAVVYKSDIILPHASIKLLNWKTQTVRYHLANK